MLRGVENFHTNNARLGVEVEDDAWTHLLALDDFRFRKADIERIDFRIVTRLHRRRPRSKKTVITRWRSPSYIYHAEHPSVALWYSPEPFRMLWIRLNHLRPAKSSLDPFAIQLAIEERRLGVPAVAHPDGEVLRLKS